MPILIDREEMCVRYRHANQGIIWNLMALEFTHTSVVAMDENMVEAYNRFTDYELKLLYLNLCGQKYTGYARDILITTVKGLVLSLPQSELVGLEIAVQAGHVLDTDTFFKYQKGAIRPIKLDARYVPPALTSVAGYVPAPAPPKPASAAPAAHTQAANPFKPSHSPSTVTLPAEAPKAGSKTGTVWEISECILKQKLEEKERNGGQLDVKSLRKAIVEACEAQGINGSTASVQYGKWKSTKVF